MSFRAWGIAVSLLLSASATTAQEPAAPEATPPQQPAAPSAPPQQPAPPPNAPPPNAPPQYPAQYPAAAQPGYGAPGPPNYNYQAPAAPRPEPPQPSPKNREARAEHVVIVGIGAFWYQLVGVGAEASLAVYLGRDTLLGVGAYRAAALVPDQRSDTLGVSIHQFLGDVMYVQGGIRVRRLDLRTGRDGDRYDDRFVQDDVGLQLGVGRRWQTDHLVFGLEAVGVHVPFKALSVEKQVLDPDNDEVLDAEPAEFRFRWDFRVAQLFVGVSF
jgi:hypothetical protein